MEKLNITPYLGMNKFPLLAGVINGIQNRINDIVDWINTPAPTNPKVYRALLSQSGTDAPTAIISPDSFSGVSYEYIDVGFYKAVSDSKFTTNKTFPKFSESIGDGGSVLINYNIISDSEIQFSVYSPLDGSYVNNGLINASIEILVYE